jgi:hypothetical protein
LRSKLEILNGTGGRRPSHALSILTGRVDPEAERPVPEAPTPRAQARTVYLSDTHIHLIERIIQSWQHLPRRATTRSAVLRQAIEHLSAAVDADWTPSPRANTPLEDATPCPSY